VNHPERYLLRLERKVTLCGSDDLRASGSRKVKISFGDSLRIKQSPQTQRELAFTSLTLTPLSLAPFDTVARSDVDLSAVAVAPITAASLWRTGTVIGGAHLACITPKRKLRLDVDEIGPVRYIPSNKELQFNGPAHFDIRERYT
jgi:hypothetical protein